MLSFGRFTVVLDACALFPMVVRDVLLTFADHEFYAPRWSARIHDEWNFAANHLESSLRIEVKHPDVFVLDLIDLNEKRALAAFKDLRARKRRPPWSVSELLDRLVRAGLVQTSAWLSSADVLPLL
ncbi:hypothetical protein [Paraburkholderia sp. BL21I4N1]|uniref:hypothetical protein n=1 Tax=Paraburkholderia sp. BL21I4N1 TaxID=1938801 RepID=UPI000D417B45|nr:hypothetical protein [Paraburkholderia sp. BL21I4N1]PQV54482.1 hypothetical protein B0G83_101664 [Paraburkholderia sp. BL21I4N1]